MNQNNLAGLIFRERYFHNLFSFSSITPEFSS